MESNKNNTEFNVNQWVARHRNAIQTTARFSGEDIIVTAVRLYKMAHRQHDVEFEELQLEAVLEKAA